MRWHSAACLRNSRADLAQPRDISFVSKPFLLFAFRVRWACPLGALGATSAGRDGRHRHRHHAGMRTASRPRAGQGRQKGEDSFHQPAGWQAHDTLTPLDLKKINECLQKQPYLVERSSLFSPPSALVLCPSPEGIVDGGNTYSFAPGWVHPSSSCSP